MNVYSGSGLEHFDLADLEGTLFDSMESVGELRQNYSNLVDIFKNVKHKKDSESYEVVLADQRVLEDFFVRLNKVETSLIFAVSSSSVYNSMEDEIKRIERDVKFYKELRRIVRIRYGDSVDMSELDSKMQQLIDSDISSREVSRITKQVNLTDKNEILREVD